MSEWWGGLLLCGYQECGSSGSKSTDTGYHSTFRIYWMWAITVELRKQKLIDCLLIVWITFQLETYRRTFIWWIQIERYNIFVYKQATLEMSNCYESLYIYIRNIYSNIYSPLKESVVEFESQCSSIDKYVIQTVTWLEQTNIIYKTYFWIQWICYILYIYIYIYIYIYSI